MSVGNDVVDLTDPETQPSRRHPRFEQRVLDSVELQALASATDSDRTLWRYWAAKESAFKAFRKLVPDLPFVPRHFRVRLRPACDGDVHYGLVRRESLTAAVEIDERADHVHAVARAMSSTGEDSDWHTGQIESGVRLLRDYFRSSWKAPGCSGEYLAGAFPAPTSPSTAGRRFALEQLAPYLACSPRDLTILAPTRRGDPPLVAIRGMPSGIDLSLSHHGRFVAFAFATPSVPPSSLHRELR